jgi:uncharacterized membrane protein
MHRLALLAISCLCVSLFALVSAVGAHVACHGFFWTAFSVVIPLNTGIFILCVACLIMAFRKDTGE